MEHSRLDRETLTTMIGAGDIDTVLVVLPDLQGRPRPLDHASGPVAGKNLVNTARQEWAASNRVVTDWELRRSFELA
jgi:hypothetical protein